MVHNEISCSIILAWDFLTGLIDYFSLIGLWIQLLPDSQSLPHDIISNSLAFRVSQIAVTVHIPDIYALILVNKEITLLCIVTRHLASVNVIDSVKLIGLYGWITTLSDPLFDLVVDHSFALFVDHITGLVAVILVSVSMINQEIAIFIKRALNFTIRIGILASRFVSLWEHVSSLADSLGHELVLNSDTLAVKKESSTVTSAWLAIVCVNDKIAFSVETSAYSDAIGVLLNIFIIKGLATFIIIVGGIFLRHADFIVLRVCGTIHASWSAESSCSATLHLSASRAFESALKVHGLAFALVSVSAFLFFV